MPKTCYRHPSTPARRRCFQCHKPICAACQRSLDHHIFCGEQCHLVWAGTEKDRQLTRTKKDAAETRTLDSIRAEVQGLNELLANVHQKVEEVAAENTGLDQRLSRLFLETQDLRQEKDGRPEPLLASLAELHARPRRPRERRYLLGALLLAVLAAAAVTAIILHSRRAETPPPVAATAPGDTAATAAAPNIVYDDLEPLLAPPTLDLGSQKLALEKSQADIGGYAPGAVSVTLFLNNRRVADRVVAERGFAFEQVPLDPGLNLIQVRATDGSGNEAYSMAQMIERLTPTAARVRETLGLNRMRGPRAGGFLALTIDAGSTNRRADRILAILREKGIKTTFFLTGQFIERFPETVRAIMADGHEVGNHTYDHPHLTTFERNRRQLTSPGVTRERLQEELLRTAKLFTDLTGRKMTPWWRAPYGEQNEEIRQWAEEIGVKHVDWSRTPTNFDMLDWVADPGDRHYLDAEGIYNRFLGLDRGRPGAANGGIILMHLGTDRKRDFLDEALPRAIDSLRERGYNFISVSEMFSR
jgi:peptidoglycan/xylan/chitin deacetylase (PgdA/CDA1 family)